MRRVEEKRHFSDELSCSFEQNSVSPSDANEWLVAHSSAPLSQRVTLSSLLLRPELSLESLLSLSTAVENQVADIPSDLRDEVKQDVETKIKYQRYIEKEQEVANRISKYEDFPLPVDFDYFGLTALSYECREKLNRYRPLSIGQASRISGISPADISILILAFASRK